MLSAHRTKLFIPTGNLLAPEVFAARHRLLIRILLAHVPVLLAIGLFRGYDPLWTVLEVSPAAAAAGLGSIGGLTRLRVRAVVVTAGLSWTSIVLVHLTGGQIESHFHFFIVLGFIALYQDWLPFTWYVGFTGLSHGLGSGLVPGLVFNHAAGQAHPWVWSAVHAGGVALLCIGLVIFWSNTESEQRRATSLATELSARDLERARVDIAQRQAQSRMLLNLARRNQSLVQRQLDTIETLESDEQRPEVLERLFSLDHMSTRMRRNAESLLVLSGAEPARIWRQPVPLSDVLRAAISEVEDYRRVDLVLGEDPRLEGRAAADLSHLFAELVENATNFSPPSARVTVSAQMSPAGEVVVVVRDHGVGMDTPALQQARALLSARVDEDGEERALTPGDARLGLQVVGLLSRRHGVGADLGAGRDGTTVEVVLPAALVLTPEPTVEPALPPARDRRPRGASHAGVPGVPTQSGPSGPDLWTPAPAPAAAPAPAHTSALAAFASRRPASGPGEPAHAVLTVDAPRSAETVDPLDAVGPVESVGAHDVVPAGALPSLPQRSREDAVSVPAPLDLWTPQQDPS